MTPRERPVPRDDTVRRGGSFVFVAALGFAVQGGAILVLQFWAELPAVPATAIGVQLALLHNFVWHDQWTWADRDRLATIWHRWIRFMTSVGVVSLTGTVLLTTLYAWLSGLPVVVANLLAVWSVGIINYLVLDRAIYARR